MSFSRLLFAKPVLQFNGRGILTSTRWCSSSSSSSSGKTEIKSSHVKGPKVAEDNRAAATESYVNEYMEMHPKVFLSAAEVQNKVGRSWNTLKGILTNLKGKILRNPQDQNQISSDISHSKVDSAASKVIMTQTSEHITKSGESKGLPHSSEVPMYSHSSKESASTRTEAHLLGENASEDAVDGTDSEVLKMHTCRDSIKLSESESTEQAAEAPSNFHCNETEDIVQSSEATRVSLSNKKDTSTGAVPCVTGGNLSGENVQSEEISDNLKVVKLGNGQRLLEEAMFGTLGKVDLASSEVITTQTSGHITESRESKSLPHFSEVTMDSHSSKESASTHTTSYLLGENSFEDVVDRIGSEVIKKHTCPDGIKLSESESTEKTAESLKDLLRFDTENIVHSSEATRISLSTKKNTSTTSFSCVTGGNHSGEMVQSEEISDNSMVVKLENEQRLPEEAMFGTLGKSDKKQNNEAQHLFSLTRYLLDGAFRTKQNENENELTSLGNGKCELEKKTATASHTLNDGSKVDKIPSLSDGSQNVKGLAELFKKTMNNQTAGEMAHKSSDILTPNESLGNSDGTLQENAARTFDIGSLIGCIKELPQGKHSSIKSQDTAMSNVTDQISSKGSIHKFQSQDKSQNSDAERIKTLLRGHTGGEDSKMNVIKEEQIVGISSNTHGENLTKNEKCSSVDIAANDRVELEPSPQVSLPTCKEDINLTPVTCFTEGRAENKVLIRFLNKDVVNSDISSSLGDCGPILKIRKVSSFEGSNFSDAFVHFKTSKGLQKALKKTEVVIKNSIAFIEATSQEEMAHKISIPSLIGDPDIPVALVKHPTHTVKIKQLTRDISSHQLKEALSFCGSGITNFFLGTSSATAYVEFETGDAKERALAKHSISVLGKQLLIFRVDAPRTTVVRIQNVNPKCYGSVKSICKSYGKIKIIKPRYSDVVDVHFWIGDWPNMLNILNSLNGLEVDGRRWLAQPAPVFPPAILQVLWSHPDERKHVKSVMHSLLRKLQHSTHTDELTDLASKLYGGGI